MELHHRLANEECRNGIARLANQAQVFENLLLLISDN